MNLSIKIISRALFFIFVVKSLHAQNAFDNHQKYWYYKSRLKNDFMKIGLKTGESIPFAQRGYRTKVDFDHPTTINFTSALNGADLISELGIYIGVLATEYQLLMLNSQNTDSVKYELYCALNAVNRLDKYAETVFYKPKKLDGFLIRDDIPRDFVRNNYKHFNYYNNWDGHSSLTWMHSPYGTSDTLTIPDTFDDNTDHGFMSINNVPQIETGSVYYRNFQYPLLFSTNLYANMSMSQDHVISLMYGLRLVTEFVHPLENYKNKPFLWGDTNYVNFVEEAQQISNRLVTFIKSKDWRIKDPNDLVKSNEEGGDIRPYAYALAQIAGKINQPATSVNNWPQFQSPVPIVDQAYHNNHSQNFGFAEWQTLAHGPGTTFDMITQIAELSAACNCIFDKTGGQLITTITWILKKIWKWLGTIFGWANQWVQSIGSMVTPLNWKNFTASAMRPNSTVTSPNAVKLEQRIKYPADYSLLTHMLLANKTASGLNGADCISCGTAYNNALNRTKNILNSAPSCGPRNFTKEKSFGIFYAYQPSYDVYEWSSPSLIEHANSLGYDNSTIKDGNLKYELFTGEYNGLDYMLYHNLYYLYQHMLAGQPGDAEIVDLSNRIINFSIPYMKGSTSVGNLLNPKTLGAFENIFADNHINGFGGIEYRAGKTITLSDGFQVDAGADFHAVITPFNCNNSQYTNDDMRKVNNSSDTTGNYGNIGDAVQLHYVEYPKVQRQKDNYISSNYDRNKKPNLQNKKIVTLTDKLLIFPNPSEGKFSITFPAIDDISKYSIFLFDAFGKNIKILENISSVNNTITVTENDLAAGTYMVRVINNNSGVQYNEKIIITH